MTARSSARSFAPYDPRTAAGRLAIATAIGVITAFVLSGRNDTAVAVAAGWDAGSVALLGLAWSILATSDPRVTQHRAAAEDPGRTAVWLIVLVASTFSVFAGSVLLRRAKSIASPGESDALVALCLIAVVSSWALTHTAYTLRYAHLYYREDREGVGGLVFPGKAPPDAFDFAHFAFTIGMCFQVSDVCVTSRQIRRAVLGHAILSFAYNTAVIALALNLVFGMVG